eukprot:681230_1
MTEMFPNTIGFWPFLMMAGPVTVGGLLALGQMTGVIHYKKSESSGQGKPDEVFRAVVVLNGDGVSGRVEFEAQSKYTGTTTIKGEVKGLKAGKYPLCINEMGDLTEGAKSLGDPDYEVGSITANAQGVAQIDITDKTGACRIESLLGRSVVIGPSAAYGVIARAQ